MNKKRFFVFFAIIFITISILAVWAVRTHRTDEPMIAVEQSADGVRFFYYRSIPGLKRAEEANLVIPIHKNYEISGKPYELKIDRIWYSKKNAYVFYHVENINKIAYLGGQFYFEGQNVEELPKFDPVENIGRPSERGVFFNDGFYSCAILPPLEDIDQNPNKLYFSPFLVIEDEQYSFEPIILEKEQLIKEEPTESFKLDASLELDDNSVLQFYELKSEISSSKLYFSYTSPNLEIIYGLIGSIRTDKGEQFEIYSVSKSNFENPGHYYIEIPPFNSMPQSLQLYIESIYIIGNDSITGSIDTNSEKKSKNSETLNQEIARIKNTTIKVEKFIVNDNSVSVEISYDNNTISELEPPYSMLKAEVPFFEHQEQVLVNTQNIYNPLPNVLSIKNNYYKSLRTGILGIDAGAWVTCPDENKISIAIPKNYWDESDRIYIELNNLTYQKVLNQSIHMDLLK